MSIKCNVCVVIPTSRGFITPLNLKVNRRSKLHALASLYHNPDKDEYGVLFFTPSHPPSHYTFDSRESIEMGILQAYKREMNVCSGVPEEKLKFLITTKVIKTNKKSTNTSNRDHQDSQVFNDHKLHDMSDEKDIGGALFYMFIQSIQVYDSSSSMLVNLNKLISGDGFVDAASDNVLVNGGGGSGDGDGGILIKNPRGCCCFKNITLTYDCDINEYVFGIKNHPHVENKTVTNALCLRFLDGGVESDDLSFFKERLCAWYDGEDL